MFSREEFGRKLREARQRKGVTQANVADLTGSTPTWISDLEKGRRTTTIEKLYILCDYYEISADYLLGLTDEPQGSEKLR